MNVKKIFITLITIVVCVVLGALVLKTLLPNVTNQLIGSVETAIHAATGMDFDINGDGNIGKPQVKSDTSKAGTGIEVDGFDGVGSDSN